MQVVKEKPRELGPRNTEQKLGWLASFVVSEVVATHNNNFEVKEWASNFFQTLSKAIGEERAHVFFDLGYVRNVLHFRACRQYSSDCQLHIGCVVPRSRACSGRFAVQFYL